MRLVCILGFKCDIPMAGVLVWLLSAWRRLRACFIPKTAENLKLCGLSEQWLCSDQHEKVQVIPVNSPCRDRHCHICYCIKKP